MVTWKTPGGVTVHQPPFTKREEIELDKKFPINSTPVGVVRGPRKEPQAPPDET